MKEKNKKRKPRKELPIALNIILIFVFAGTFIYFGISKGFLINSLLNCSIDDLITYSFKTLLVGIVYMLVLLILIRNSDSENVQPIKWYINCILISATINFAVTALTVFVLGIEENHDINYLVGFCMFPLIGIITTPNVVNHVKKDTSKWKGIFYNNGNLDSVKDSTEFYRVHIPVEFEKKILSAVYKEQFKNIMFVIGYMAIVIVTFLGRVILEHNYSGDVIMDYIEMKAQRASGFFFFATLFFVVFGIPIVAYYVANFLKKVKVVKKHEYIAYHAIVPSVHNGKIYIWNDNKHYSYKYCTCVGIRERNVKDTPATLIFVPDDVFIFPDSEDCIVNK